MQFHKAERVDLKGSTDFSENKLQQLITNDPEILGLGKVDVRDIERRQFRAGRFDLLLEDPDNEVRYVVELQLGATDESHIIRTIEYWDLERRRFPNYDHVAVIVAEDVTSRFFNVVNLFNNFIPLIAIQIQGCKVNGAFTIVATRVLDLSPSGPDEDGSIEPVDRAYWEKKGSPFSLGLVDQVIESIVQDIESGLQAKYNKHYIGLAIQGVPKNFVSFIPRKQHVVAMISLPLTDQTTEQIERLGVTLLKYDSQFRNYRVRLTETDLANHSEGLSSVFAEAHKRYGR